MKSIESKKGITLIALVITIVILIILAGVAINFTVGEDGIIKRAQYAVEQYKIENAREKISLSIAEYHAKMKEETLYSILNKIQGLEGINPENENSKEYIIVVDGFEFLITEELEIIYQGKSNGIIPEILKIEKHSTIEEEKTKITIEIEAKTQEEKGIEKIALIKNGIVILEKDIGGNVKEITEEFEIKGNGKYTIKVIGGNKKQITSNEIEVTELSTLSATLQAGTVIDGSVMLTITGESEKEEITKIQIYDGNIKIKEFEYEETVYDIEEVYQIESIAFYEEKKYIAHIITENTKGITNEVKPMNTDTIKTETDLKNLTTEVNKGRTFEGMSIKQIGDINLTQNHIAIGTQTTPFKGTYDGQGYIIENLKITNQTADYQGLFGYVENATLKNIILGTGSVTGGNRVGGVVGYAKKSTLDNIINKSTKVESCTTYEESFTYYPVEYDGKSKKEESHNMTKLGGICGEGENIKVNNCENNANVVSNTNGTACGGVIGYIKNDEIIMMVSCKNNGTVMGNVHSAGGIVGMVDGSVQIEECVNNAKVNSTSNCVGGIVGMLLNNTEYIKSCVNSANIEGNVEVGGIVGGLYGKNTTKTSIENNLNTGEIKACGRQSMKYQYSGEEGIVYHCATGGIIGLSINGLVDKCENKGIVNLTSQIDESYGLGGIVGIIINSSVTNSYNVAKIGNEKNASGAAGIVRIWKI